MTSRLKSLGILFLLCLSFLFVNSSSVPRVGAQPSYSTDCIASGTPSGSLTCSLVAVTGDMVVVAESNSYCTMVPCSAVTFPPTPNISHAENGTVINYTALEPLGAGADYWNIGVWVATVTQNGSLSVTAPFATNAASAFLEVFDFTNGGYGKMAASGNGYGICLGNSCTGDAMTTNTVSFSSGDTAVFVGVTPGSGALSPLSGWAGLANFYQAIFYSSTQTPGEIDFAASAAPPDGYIVIGFVIVPPHPAVVKHTLTDACNYSDCDSVLDSYPLNITATGDVVIVTVQTIYEQNDPVVATSVSFGGSGPYAVEVYSQSACINAPDPCTNPASGGMYVSMWEYVTTSNASLPIYVTFGNSTDFTGGSWQAYDVEYGTTSIVGMAYGVCNFKVFSCDGLAITSTDVDFYAGDLAVSSIVNSKGADYMSPLADSNYTQVGNATLTNGTSYRGGLGSYSTNPGSPTLFPWNLDPTSSQWLEIGVVFGVAPYTPATVEVKIDPQNSAPPNSAYVYGCDANVTSITMENDYFGISVQPDCSLTFSPYTSNYTRYVFSNDGKVANSWTITTPSSGSADFSNITYYQLFNFYAMTPAEGISTPWDHTYIENATGTLLGSTNRLVCSVPLIHGTYGISDCGGFADYDRAVSLPEAFNSQTVGVQWVANASVSFTDTTGDNFHIGYYGFFVLFYLNLSEQQSGPYQYFKLAGCGIGTTYLEGNDAVHLLDLTSNNCQITVSNEDNSTSRVRFVTTGTNEVQPTIVAGQTYLYYYNYQVNVTVSTDNSAVSSTTPSGTYWADYDTPFTVTANIVYNSANLPEGRFVDWTSTGGATVANPSGYISYASATSHGTIEAVVDTIEYSVSQPNPLTISFWVFPFIIIGYFTMEFLVIPMRRGATTWARNYSMLTGFVVGSIIALATETLEFFVLLLAMVLWFFYSYRG